MTKQTQIRKLENHLNELVAYGESRRKGSAVRTRYLGYADEVREQLRAVDH